MKISKIINRYIVPVRNQKVVKQESIALPSDIVELSASSRLKAIKKDLDDVFKVKFDKALASNNQYQVYELWGSDYYKQLEEILQKAKHINEVLAVLKKYASFSNDRIKEIAESFIEDIDKFNAFHKMRAKRDFTRQLYQEMSENLPMHDEPLQKYIERKIKLVKQNNIAKKAEHLEKIKSKIKYGTDTGSLDIVELTPEERLEFVRVLGVDPKINDDKLYEQFINRYVDGELKLKEVSVKATNAALKTQPRYYYEMKKSIDREYIHEPLYRWLSILDKTDEFVAETFKVGQVYKYPYMQSCSKDRLYAENQYRCDLKELNIQFIIHPRSPVSKAYDIGYRSYGSNEAIYPANTKFIVLDKRLEECDGEFGETFYRWIIEMQEV